jgi:6-phosphogluconate dehydrogenase
MIITYAQGMALLAVASDKYKYHLDLEAVARIWRGGCIIRAALLEDICAAFRARRDLPNLLLDSSLSRKVMEHQEDLRQVVGQAAEAGCRSGADGFAGLSRRLSQRLAAGQSHSGSARLFWSPHL